MVESPPYEILHDRAQIAVRTSTILQLFGSWKVKQFTMDRKCPNVTSDEEQTALMLNRTYIFGIFR